MARRRRGALQRTRGIKMFSVRGRAGASAVTLGVVMALLVGPAVPTSAAPQPVSFSISGGQLSFAGQTVSLPPGGQLSGTWDEATGAFSGDLVLGRTTLPVDASVANLGTINLTFDVSATRVTGTVPADGSPGSLASSFTFVISATEPLPLTCDLGPIAFELSASLSDGTITASQSGFEVPVLVATPTCGIAQAASSLLGLPSTDSSVELVFVRDTAGAAPAVTSAPLFTG
jgi:hypothetical protein